MSQNWLIVEDLPVQVIDHFRLYRNQEYRSPIDNWNYLFIDNANLLICLYPSYTNKE